MRKQHGRAGIYQSPVIFLIGSLVALLTAIIGNNTALSSNTITHNVFSPNTIIEVIDNYQTSLNNQPQTELDSVLFAANNVYKILNKNNTKTLAPAAAIEVIKETPIVTKTVPVVKKAKIKKNPPIKKSNKDKKRVSYSNIKSRFFIKHKPRNIMLAANLVTLNNLF